MLLIVDWQHNGLNDLNALSNQAFNEVARHWGFESMWEIYWHIKRLHISFDQAISSRFHITLDEHYFLCSIVILCNQSSHGAASHQGNDTKEEFKTEKSILFPLSVGNRRFHTLPCCNKIKLANLSYVLSMPRIITYMGLCQLIQRILENVQGSAKVLTKQNIAVFDTTGRTQSFHLFFCFLPDHLTWKCLKVSVWYRRN